MAVEEQSNEITAVPRLLELLSWIWLVWRARDRLMFGAVEQAAAALQQGCPETLSDLVGGLVKGAAMETQLGDAARQLVHRHANGCITRSALTPSPNSRPVANEAKFAKAPIGHPSTFFDIHAGNPQSVTRDLVQP